MKFQPIKAKDNQGRVFHSEMKYQPMKVRIDILVISVCFSIFREREGSRYFIMI